MNCVEAGLKEEDQREPVTLGIERRRYDRLRSTKRKDNGTSCWKGTEQGKEEDYVAVCSRVGKN